jgi:hypothetical protein
MVVQAFAAFMFFAAWFICAVAVFFEFLRYAFHLPIIS